jgi:hypothetical protein
MNIMPNANSNEVTNVTLTVTIRDTPGDLFAIKTVLTEGAGTLTKVIQGGQQKFFLTLNKGKEIPKFKFQVGESVGVAGREGGEPINLPGPLQVIRTHEPWEFDGQFGTP